jgi:polar amino acid transport system substrate-binding protein
VSNKYKHLIFLGIFYSTFSFFQNIVTLAVGEWPPYIDKKLPHHGDVIRLIARIFKSGKYKIKYEWLPWKRASTLVKSGKYDATPASMLVN